MRELFYRNADGRIMATPRLWATEYKTGWTVYSMPRGLLYEGLSEEEAMDRLWEEMRAEASALT